MIGVRRLEGRRIGAVNGNCYVCGKLGHYIRNCIQGWTRQPYQSHHQQAEQQQWNREEREKHVHPLIEKLAEKDKIMKRLAGEIAMGT